MDKIFRLTKVAKFSDGDENFVQRKILSHIVFSDKVSTLKFSHSKKCELNSNKIVAVVKIFHCLHLERSIY